MSDNSTGKDVLDKFNEQIDLAGTKGFKSLVELIDEALIERYKQGCTDQKLLTRSACNK